MGPIGVFDSGYGGLTVLSEIHDKMPEYDYLYLGDNARAPYGTRSFDVVYEFTLQAVKELFDRGCELVILACNTASAKALRTIQQRDLEAIDPEKRVLGVIRPSAEIVGQYSTSNHIGVLATEGTVSSESYVIEFKKFAPSATVIQHACPLWVPLIESNEHETEEGRSFIRKDVLQLLEADKRIDTILLGCTHYPLVKDYIESIVPDHINVISQGPIVADSLKDYLRRHPWMDAKCSKSGSIHFLTTESPDVFDAHATQFFGKHVKSTHITLH